MSPPPLAASPSPWTPAPQITTTSPDLTASYPRGNEDRSLSKSDALDGPRPLGRVVARISSPTSWRTACWSGTSLPPPDREHPASPAADPASTARAPHLLG